VQPVHIVIGTTVLAVAIVAVLVHFMQGNATRNHPAQAAKGGARAVSYLNDDQLNGKGSATMAPPVTGQETANPPATGTSEGPQTIAGLPGVVVTPGRPKQNAASSATNTSMKGGTSSVPPGSALPPTIATPNKGGNEVPPFSPLASNNSSGGTDVDTQVSLLKPVLEDRLKNSKLPATLDSITLDPRTNSLTLKYTIPNTPQADDKKKLLLYTGFQLLWAAAEQNKSFAYFTLRGYASEGSQSAPTLALIADVSMQQTDAARSIRDYHSILPYLSNPWWRPDLKAIAL
jgi:hypothetical protein